MGMNIKNIKPFTMIKTNKNEIGGHRTNQQLHFQRSGNLYLHKNLKTNVCSSFPHGVKERGNSPDVLHQVKA